MRFAFRASEYFDPVVYSFQFMCLFDYLDNLHAVCFPCYSVSDYISVHI
jgi:hypothetical protein